MKMQFLLAGIVATGLFVSTPGAVAHGGSGHGGGSWGGHGGGSWGGHGGGSWGGHGGGSWGGREVAFGAVMVTALGLMVTDFTTTDGFFSAPVLASMATATRGGGIGTIRAIPIIPIRTTAIRITATHTTAIRTTAIRPMATRTMAIRTTKTVLLAHPLPRRSKRRSHGAATIAVRLTVQWGRRLAMQSDHFKRIKACRLPARWTAG